MMKRLLTLVMLLVLTPLRVYDQPITLMVQLPDTLRATQNGEFIIRVTAADTLAYDFWSQLPDSQFVQRTTRVVVAVRRAAGIDAPIRLCRVDSLVVRRFCRPEWMQGQWQVRVDAWRWLHGYKYQQSVVRSFVVW